MLLTAATLSAFIGAWAGNRLLHKITIRAVQWTIAAMLLLIAVGLVSGLI